MKITVFIKPNSKHTHSVERLADGGYRVWTQEPAVEGKANLAAAKLLAVHFGVTPSRIKLIRGTTSRYKTFEISQ